MNISPSQGLEALQDFIVAAEAQRFLADKEGVKVDRYELKDHEIRDYRRNMIFLVEDLRKELKREPDGRNDELHNPYGDDNGKLSGTFD